MKLFVVLKWIWRSFHGEKGTELQMRAHILYLYLTQILLQEEGMWMVGLLAWFENKWITYTVVTLKPHWLLTLGWVLSMHYLLTKVGISISSILLCKDLWLTAIIMCQGHRPREWQHQDLNLSLPGSESWSCIISSWVEPYRIPNFVIQSSQIAAISQDKRICLALELLNAKMIDVLIFLYL